MLYWIFDLDSTLYQLDDETQFEYELLRPDNQLSYLIKKFTVGGSGTMCDVDSRGEEGDGGERISSRKLLAFGEVRRDFVGKESRGLQTVPVEKPNEALRKEEDASNYYRSTQEVKRLL